MLKTLLKEKRREILENWFSLTVKTYPGDAVLFYSGETNQFANPVGATIRREIATLFDLLTGDADMEALRLACREINKIRAVQDFTAAQATAFIFFLKRAIREVLADRLSDPAFGDELVELESAIDGIALFVFDTYMECRERLHEIRVADVKRRAGLSRNRSD